MIDYGAGNIGSVINMLRHIGVSADVVDDASQLKSSGRIILPGVGSWDAGVRKLIDSEFVGALGDRVLGDGVPILGICLGMQLLLNSSEEGDQQGLGWIDGSVQAFDFAYQAKSAKRLPVPHMGWNSVDLSQECSLTHSLDENSKFYFVHSFHAVVTNTKNIMMHTDYGYPFVSGIKRDNIYGVQFHPEKSHKHGMNLLKSFASI